jgi:hypothetical protein
MNLQRVTTVLETPTKETVQALLEDQSTVFLVDWREEDDAIVEYCEAILQTGSLLAELIEFETEEGHELHIQYRSKRVKVPLDYSIADRHITLCALNECSRTKL